MRILIAGVLAVRSAGHLCRPLKLPWAVDHFRARSAKRPAPAEAERVSFSTNFVCKSNSHKGLGPLLDNVPFRSAMLLLQVRESAFGIYRTSGDVRLESAK
jgi:hypothetical protein